MASALERKKGACFFVFISQHFCNTTLSFRRHGSDDGKSMNGASTDLDIDRLKQEIMADIRKEFQKFKLEIVEGLSCL